MGARIALIQGHPDARGGHLGHALADAYAEAALAAGHELRRIEVARLQFPVLRTRDEWEDGLPAPDIAQAQDTMTGIQGAAAAPGTMPPAPRPEWDRPATAPLPAGSSAASLGTSATAPDPSRDGARDT